MTREAAYQLNVTVPHGWTHNHLEQLISTVEQYAGDVHVADGVLTASVEIDLHDDPFTAGMQLARHFDEISDSLAPYGVHAGAYEFVPCADSPWPHDTTLV
jgi:hypothetical protein